MITSQIVKDQDKLNEALLLLEFVEDLTVAWDIGNMDIRADTLQSLSLFTGIIRKMIEDSFKKETS